MGKGRRELTETERTRRCGFCGAMPGQRCPGTGGSLYPYAHADREPGGRARPGPAPGPAGACVNCSHPCGLHVIDQWEPRVSHCRSCTDCPGYEER